MARKLDSIYGPGGILYGCEWDYDQFDYHNDRVILDGKLPARVSGMPQVAIDIGCAHGNRLLTLAQLGTFDLVIGCDIEDRTSQITTRAEQLQAFYQASRITTHWQPTQIKFLKTSVSDLQPSDFEGMNIVFVNFRNVPHYLAPAHLRDSVSKFYDMGADGALLAISFNCIGGSRFWTPRTHQSIYDQSDPEKFYTCSRDIPSFAAYGEYHGAEVEKYMQETGFSILPMQALHKTTPVTSFNNHPVEDLRDDEHRILAQIPHSRTKRPQNG